MKFRGTRHLYNEAKQATTSVEFRLRSSVPSPADLPYRVLAVLIVAAVPLKAYADPGSGMLLWQIAGAFFVGCAYQVRKFFIRFRKKK
jgi:hypothetical protein